MSNITAKTIITMILAFPLIMMFSFLAACSLSQSAAPETVDIASVPGVTPPARGSVAADAAIETDQYTGTIVWSPADPSFEGGTAYTAAITLTPKAGYTLTGVPENFFTIEGADSVAHSADSGTITAVFPATAPPMVVDIPDILGVAPPVRGAVPAAAVTETRQYAGTISWAPANNRFAGATVYTATITLTPNPGYTFTGVPQNFFTVAGAESVSSEAGSGVITAIFPATATEEGDTITAGNINYKVLSISGTAGTAEVISGIYSGAVAIPETIDACGVTYTVVSVGGGAFYGSSKLTGIYLPESVASIGKSAFCNCSSLESVNIPGNVASIANNTFNNCSRLKYVGLPSGLTTIGNYAFYSCIGLETVGIPESVTSIGDYAFAYCGSLTGITIPGSDVSVGDYAFYSCVGLETVGLPGSITSIGDYAFAYCSSLTGITIRGGDIYIGEGAFQNCSSLESLYIIGNAFFGRSS